MTRDLDGEHPSLFDVVAGSTDPVEDGGIADQVAEIVIEEQSASEEIEARMDAIERELRQALRKQQNFADEVGKLVRQAVDYVIDAPTMRRYALSDLEPDEKTTIGKRIERLLRRELKLPKGDKLDIKINGEEIDIKTSCTKSRSWMFSRRNVNHFNLLIAYNEDAATYDLGLVYVTEDILGADNRDKKRGMTGDKGAGSARGLKGEAEKVSGSINWLVKCHPYEPNFLAHLPPTILDEIVSKRSGAARVRELLRKVINVPIPRHAIAAVANQKDPKRRDRGGDGGARAPLWKEGLMILSGAYAVDNDIVEAVTRSRLAQDHTMVMMIEDERLSVDHVSAYRVAHSLPALGSALASSP